MTKSEFKLDPIGTQTYALALEIIDLIEAEGEQARFVGGCIRDMLLERTPKDFDIATTARPEKILKIFSNRPFQALPLGIQFGTITVVYRRKHFEITTLREDIKNYGRKAKVKFTTSFKADAERRDFTMNALYRDRSGKLYDYFSGVQHIKEKKIIFVGDAAARIQEDYLRILRFFRFICRYHFNSNKETYQAIADHKQGLSIISKERILSELIEIFSYRDIEPYLQKMNELDLFSYMISSKIDYRSLQGENIHKICKTIDDSSFNEHQYLFYVILILQYTYKTPAEDNSNNRPQVQQILKDMKLSHKSMQFIDIFTAIPADLKKISDSPSDSLLFLNHIEKYTKPLNLSLDTIFHFVEHCIKNEILDYTSLDPKWQNMMLAEEKYGYRRKTRFPIDGHTLMKELEIKQSAELGQYILLLQRSFLDGKWQTKSEGVDIIKKIIKDNNEKSD